MPDEPIDEGTQLDDNKESNPETPAEVTDGEGDSGVQPWDWRAEIPEDLRDQKVWESVPDFPTLAKNYVDSVAYNVGALKLPDADAPPEEWNKVWDKLGRPAAPEGYSDATLEDDEEQDDALLEAMKPVVHVAGVSERQWQVIRDGYARYVREGQAKQRQEMQETTAQLKEEWGGAYENKVGFAQRVLRSIGGEELVDDVVQSGLGNNTRMLRFLANVGKALADENIIDSNFEGHTTKDEALSQIETLTTSEEYLDATHPNHASAVARAKTLFEVAYN